MGVVLEKGEAGTFLTMNMKKQNNNG